MKLDFVIVGGMKCGSTAVGSFFSKHPEVNFCKIIEGDYFAHNNMGIKNLTEYFRVYFNDQPGLKGESSPTYSHPGNLPGTALKLKSEFPDVKVILIVRNPYKRIESHMNHLRLNGHDIPKEFDECIIKFPNIINNSCFGFMVDEYLKVFGKEQFMVVNFEDIISGVGLDLMCDYLEIKKIQEKLPMANKTDLRYVELPITKFYKSHWVKFGKIPGFDLIKKPLKVFLDKFFSKKLSTTDIYLSIQTNEKIKEVLREDVLLFKKHYGYSPFNLKR